MTLNADELKELRAKAEALGGNQDWRLVTHTDDAKRIGPYVVRRAVGAVAAVPRESPITSGALDYMAFIAALNPATALSLITAAELNAELVEGLIVAKNMADNAVYNLNQAGLTSEIATCERAFQDIYNTLAPLIAKAKGQTDAE